MSVDLSKIKPGDEVLVRLTVYLTDFYRPTGAESFVSEDLGVRDVPAHLIVSHTPKALAVGDRVKGSGWTSEFTIIAIDGEWSWLKDVASCRIQMPLSDLERVS